MLIGTSTKPRSSTFLAQAAMRSMVAGCADARPTALPFWRAVISSRFSAWSISVGVGTASITTSVLAKGMFCAPAIWPAIERDEAPSST